MEKRKKLQKNNQILIIDDHPVFLEGFKAIINRDGRFTVAGHAETVGRSLTGSTCYDLRFLYVQFGRDGYQSYVGEHR